MRKISSIFIGSKQKFTLDHRIFNLTSLLGGIAFVQSAFLDTFFHQNYFIGILTSFLAILFFGIYFLSRKKGVFIDPIIILVFVVLLFTLPLLWIGNEGINGSISYWIVYQCGVISVLLVGWKKFTLLFLNIFILVTLAILDYNGIIVSRKFTSELARLVDLLSQIVIVSLISSFLISILVQEYRSEHKRVLEFANRDYLSGLFTRRYMLEQCESEIVKMKRSQKMFVLILCDVDDFKLINDKHGHDMGDYVIQKLGGILKGGIREQDIVARWGGEEFLILLPETNIEHAHSIALKLQQCIKEGIWLSNNINLNPTLSFGINRYNDRSGTTSIETCIKGADNALFESKRQGKDTITVYSKERLG